MNSRLFLFLVVAVLAFPGREAFANQTDPLARQREMFQRAQTALNENRLDEFNSLRSRLKRYPLYGYLEYAELRKNLAGAAPERIEAFVATYRDQPIADRLYVAWLQNLVDGGDWKTFLAHYRPQSSVALQCHYLRARLDQTPAERAAILEQALPLWLVGYSQPKSCDPVFEALDKAGLLNRDRRWERIRLAFDAGRTSIAQYVAKPLPEADRLWVDRWEQMHRKPAETLRQPWIADARADTATPLNTIVVHGLKRLARADPEEAWRLLQALPAPSRPADADYADVVHDIALFGALNQVPDAGRWLAAVPGSATDAAIATWRVRDALLNRDWNKALLWIDALDLDARNSPEWTYWRAYALSAAGDEQQARPLYEQVMNERNYYGFLAADHLDRAYSMNNERIAFDENVIAALEQSPGLVRARELLRLDMRLDARREWQAAIAGLDDDKLAYAAEIARRWGWHDRAIATAANARYWSDLILRFPLAHQDAIETNADRYAIDPALIYGVVRQESAFMEDARSRVGAMGLMQLMPATARLTARAAGLRYRGSDGLLEPDYNIRLGSAYFRRMLDRFDNSPVLAASAYNAGPHRVDRWLPADGTLPADLWLLRIPIRETHGYVQNVLAYATVFDWRTQRSPTRMSSRMPPVSAPSPAAVAKK